MVIIIKRSGGVVVGRKDFGWLTDFSREWSTLRHSCSAQEWTFEGNTV
jgi:hypothetical protein